MPSLVQVDVFGLLGQFDHSIQFPQDWDFVILHGPNGVGKTKLLELIQAVAEGAAHVIRRIPFDRASLQFEDGAVLEIARTGQPTLLGGSDEFDDDGAPGIEFRLVRTDTEDEVWRPSLALEWSPQLARAIERELPALRRVASRAWRDALTHEELHLEDLVMRYPTLSKYTDSEPLPSQMSEFLAAFPVHLIETQRLLQIEPSESRARDLPARTATVTQYARDLTGRLREALAQNSRTSQELDRTFPRRLLSGAPLPADATEDHVRTRYQEQNALRTRLAEISLLDRTDELPLPDQQLADWQLRVLWTYLEDSERKLDTFRALLDRVRLFREIVNSHFLYKELRIDQERGFSFVTDVGRELKADDLSSGEQHELVLAYELLFRVQPGSLVLIDEPEISLHVAWQQQFLNDIAQIADLNPLRFVIATHSPQIIHKWWDRAIALVPGDTERVTLT